MNKENLITMTVNQKTNAIDLYNFIQRCLPFDTVIELYKLIQYKLINLDDEPYDYCNLAKKVGSIDESVNRVGASNEIVKYIEDLEQQVEELDKKLFFTKNELDMREKSINNQLNQQNEFIKWLEDYLNLFDYRDIQEQAGYDMLEEILQKYKEIIGE